MAYRLPSDRRDRAIDSYAPSYLDDFLDQIEPLQASTKSTFSDIRHLDDRVDTIFEQAQAAADESVRRATSKVAIESVRRQYHEFIHLQASAKEFSDKKINLAADARDSIVNVIADLDEKLIEFEAQLKKDGRWPGAPLPQPLPQADKPPLPPRPPEPPVPTKSTLKTRRKEPIPPNPATPRAAALAAARAGSGTVKATDDAEDVEMGPIKLEKVMKEEAVAVAVSNADTTKYCTCRRVSLGNMVGCEGKNCAIEWFHFECVGLKEEPKGAWYCSQCSEKKRKTGGRRKH